MYVRDNIGLVLEYLPRESICMSRHHLAVMTQPFGVPILSPVVFMHVGDPFFKLKFTFLTSF